MLYSWTVAIVLQKADQHDAITHSRMTVTGSAQAYQQLSEQLNRRLRPKLLLGWHVDVINKQHHVLAHRRPVPAITTIMTTDCLLAASMTLEQNVHAPI